MSTINITNARKDLYRLIENVNRYNEPALIVVKNGNAVLLSDEYLYAIPETLFLDSIPGMTESVRKGLETPVEDCIPEDMVEW